MADAPRHPRKPAAAAKIKKPARKKPERPLTPAQRRQQNIDALNRKYTRAELVEIIKEHLDTREREARNAFDRRMNADNARLWYEPRDPIDDPNEPDPQDDPAGFLEYLERNQPPKG